LSSRGGLQADEGSASRLFQQPLRACKLWSYLVRKKGRRGRLPDSRPEAGATFNRRYIQNVGVTFGNFLTGILVPKKGLELEAPRRRERSGSLLPKSRAQRGTSLASNLHWNLGAEEGTRTPTPLRVHGPEPCASANSATSARVEASEILAGQEAKLLYRWDAEIRNELSAFSHQLSAKTNHRCLGCGGQKNAARVV
jgi:hypothetical protein